MRKVETKVNSKSVTPRKKKRTRIESKNRIGKITAVRIRRGYKFFKKSNINLCTIIISQ